MVIGADWRILVHFGCPCGKNIRDTSDFLPYAAYSIADRDLEYFEEIRDLETISGNHHLFKHQSFRYMNKYYQCDQCGRLFFTDIDDPQRFISFIPEGEPKKFLVTDSTFAKQWEDGRLYGEWDLEREGECANPGILRYTENDKRHRKLFETFEELEAAYREKFDEMRLSDKIISARLTSGKTTIHSWSYQSEFRESVAEETAGRLEHPEWDKRLGWKSLDESIAFSAKYFDKTEEEVAERILSPEFYELWKQRNGTDSALS